MIVYLQGKILEVSDGSVVVLCNGIGYEVNITKNSAQELVAGQEVVLYVAESISPYDGTMLYGFLHKEDKELWQLFRDAIPNTGAKKALDLLNKAPSHYQARP